MITVACCLWGAWPGEGWGEEYVVRLYNGVARNLTVPYRFVCFADDVSRVPEGIEARPLKAPSWKGCLPKIYLYSPEAGLEGRVLLFDLDNVITGSLDDMAAYDGDIAVRAWFAGYPVKKVADGDMIGFRAGCDVTRRLWADLSSDPVAAEKETGGRERWFIRERCTPDLWQDLLPGQIVSYKNHIRNKDLPENARVVSFHGDPRPHTLDHDWLRTHWH